jgi:hypothetical protein
MTLSDYFQDLSQSYGAELDDLRHDTDGKDVLQKRLRDKRRELTALLPMIDVCPELVAPVFHGAFTFARGRGPVLEELLAGCPGEFPAWTDLLDELSIAGWAEPLVVQVRTHEQGEDFLATSVGLEYLHSMGVDTTVHAPQEEDDEDSGADDDGFKDEGEDLPRVDADATDDYLEQHGFDRRSSE